MPMMLFSLSHRHAAYTTVIIALLGIFVCTIVIQSKDTEACDCRDTFIKKSKQNLKRRFYPQNFPKPTANKNCETVTTLKQCT